MGYSPRRGLHLQRGEVPPARQPEPGAGRDRGLPAVPRGAARRDPARGRSSRSGSSLPRRCSATDTPITRLRGQWREYVGIPLMPTFHPAYLLRNPRREEGSLDRPPGRHGALPEARGLREAPRPCHAAASTSGRCTVPPSPGTRGATPSTGRARCTCPEGYVAGARRYPVVVLLHAFMGSVLGWFNAAPFTPSILDRLDALFAAGAPPFLAVFPDGLTALGGSQWIDSPGNGAYGTDDRPGRARPRGPHATRRSRSAGARAVAGRSSGGYGAWQLIAPLPGRVRSHGLALGGRLLRVLLPPRVPQGRRRALRRQAAWIRGGEGSSGGSARRRWGATTTRS